VIFWVIFRKRRFLLSLICIALGYNHLSGLFRFNTTSHNTESKESYKILSFNVRLFDKYNWIEGKDTKHRILRFLKNSEADIICFQEFLSYSIDKTTIADTLDYFLGEGEFHFSNYNEISKKQSLVTFTKLPIVHKGFINDPILGKSAIFTDIVIKTDTIRIINIHLASNHLGYADYTYIDNLENQSNKEHIRGISTIISKIKQAYITREKQANILHDFISISPYRVILCGDFNEPPLSYVHKLVSSNMLDAFKVSGVGMSNTYVRRFFQFRIDYIMVSPSINTYNYKDYRLKISDHYPVSCRFNLK